MQKNNVKKNLPTTRANNNDKVIIKPFRECTVEDMVKVYMENDIQKDDAIATLSVEVGAVKVNFSYKRNKNNLKSKKGHN